MITFIEFIEAYNNSVTKSREFPEDYLQQAEKDLITQAVIAKDGDNAHKFKFRGIVQLAVFYHYSGLERSDCDLALYDKALIEEVQKIADVETLDSMVAFGKVNHDNIDDVSFRSETNLSLVSTYLTAVKVDNSAARSLVEQGEALARALRSFL